MKHAVRNPLIEHRRTKKSMCQIIAKVHTSLVDINHAQVSPEIFRQHLAHAFVTQNIIHALGIHYPEISYGLKDWNAQRTEEVPQDVFDLGNQDVNGLHKIVIPVCFSSGLQQAAIFLREKGRKAKKCKDWKRQSFGCIWRC